MHYVMECKRILQLFGSASGLQCIWEHTKAAFIPGGPPPTRIQADAMDLGGEPQRYKSLRLLGR